LHNFKRALHFKSIMRIAVQFELGKVKGPTGIAEGAKVLSEQFDAELISPMNFDQMVDTLSKYVHRNLPEKIIIFGGDHSITYAGVLGLVRKCGRGTLVYLDAHLDCDIGFLPPSHEDVIRAIVQQKLIEPQNIIIIGARKWWPIEQQFISEHKIQIFTPDDVKSKFDLIAQKLASLPKPIYCSIDLDVLDPKVFPGTNYLEPNGLELEQLLSLLKVIDWTVLDIVEFNPRIEKERSLGVLKKLIANLK